MYTSIYVYIKPNEYIQRIYGEPTDVYEEENTHTHTHPHTHTHTQTHKHTPVVYELVTDVQVNVLPIDDLLPEEVLNSEQQCSGGA
jgi:hypothetical protein